MYCFDSANGAKEIIKNNENGYLIKNRDKNEMVEKIIELLMDKEKRIMFGKNGHNMSKSFDNNKVIKTWNKLIEKNSKE